MGAVEYAWGVSLLATAWFGPIGAIRMIAYRTGDVDHTPGMRNIALIALGVAAVSALTLIILTAVILSR